MACRPFQGFLQPLRELALLRLYSNAGKPLDSLADQINKFFKESPVPTSRGERLLRFGGLAASIGIGAAGGLLKRLTLAGTNGGGSLTSVLLSAENVERIVSTLTRMRGAALKLGQMVSMQDNDIFPPEIEAIFARVRDGANFMPTWQMLNVLRDELGPNWRANFADFEAIPFAAASIGQVHRAKLTDGREVAVKIQYPGVAQSIVSDLENLRTLLMISQLLPKGLFLENSIQVAQRELAWECDYHREAEFMRKFQDFLKEEDAFLIPRLSDLSTGRVLIADYLPGIPVNNLTDAPQELRDRIALRIVRLCLREVFEFHCMQTDPNWSNFLYRDEEEGERIVLLDFGSSREFPSEFVAGYAQIIRAAARQDKPAIIEWSQKLGFLTGDETVPMVDAHVEAVLALGLPFAAEGQYDFSLASEQVTSQIRRLLPTMINYRLTPPPDESYSLHRKLSGCFLLCTKLRARVDCRALLEQILPPLPNDNDEHGLKSSKV